MEIQLQNHSLVSKLGHKCKTSIVKKNMVQLTKDFDKRKPICDICWFHQLVRSHVRQIILYMSKLVGDVFVSLLI